MFSWSNASWRTQLKWMSLFLSLVFLLSVLWFVLNNGLNRLEGTYRIVSVWTRDVKRMNHFEVTTNRRFTISAEGLFKLGRRGLDGIVSRSISGTGEYLLTQNSNGDTFRLRMSKNGDVLIAIGDRRDDVIVARKIKRK